MPYVVLREAEVAHRDGHVAPPARAHDRADVVAIREEVLRGAEVVRDWLRRSLMHSSALEKLDEEEGQIPTAEPPTPPEGDSRLTPLIARRYAQQRELMAIHQREAASAERRRGQAIELLFKIQDRRVRSAVPEVEVVEGTSD